MARNKKTPTSSPSASPRPQRQPRTPSPKKKASGKASPAKKEVSMSPQTQSASHKKKCGVKPSPSAIKATENKTPNGGKNAANMSPDNNKSVVELQRFINLARKQSVGAKSVEKSPANNTKPVVTTPKNQNKPSHTKPQSNKSSSSISEEELDRIFPGAKKERESPEASIGRLLYDTFDQVSKASGAKGLEASRWASPSASTQSSRPVIEKSESPNYQNNKSRTPSRRNNKMNSSNNTSASSSPSPRGRTGHPASRRTTKTSGHTVAPIINTPETIVAVKESARVGKILFDAFNDLGKTSTRAGLEASRWAVISDDKAQKNNAHVNKAPIVTTNKPIPTNNAWSQNVNIDNTSAFLAALKARSAPVSKQADTSLVENKKDVASKSPIREHNITTPVKSPVQVAPKTISQESSPEMNGAMRPSIKSMDNSPSNRSASNSSSSASNVSVNGVMENREHLQYFSSWGPLLPRNRSPAEVRRIILSPIPDFLASPNKVLSLVHGGRIETVHYFPKSKSAHVLFCDPAASKRFYNAYPNGIKVNVNGRKAVVFVDKWKDVDVVSSRLQESLRLGATRVVRGVGVDLGLNMQSLATLAEERKFRLENIIDVFDGITRTRTVTFRLCSLEHAVRLRSVLVRHKDWEHANVQYGTDPCEFATGIHCD